MKQNDVSKAAYHSNWYLNVWNINCQTQYHMFIPHIWHGQN